MSKNDGPDLTYWKIEEGDQNEARLLLFLIIALASISLSILFLRASSTILAAEDQETASSQTYLPVVIKKYPIGISGMVTFAGQPASAIEVDLYVFKEESWSLSKTTQTNVFGIYQFSGVDSLQPGQQYYVRFGPNFNNPDYVFSWYGPIIHSYNFGDRIIGGNFDIADVVLRDPSAGAEKLLPVTFTWEKRGVGTDTYRVALIESNGDGYWPGENLGYVDTGTLTSLPSGIKYNNEYAWYVEVFAEPDSFGESFLLNEITFRESFVQNATTSSRGFTMGASPPAHSRSSRQ